VGVVHVRNTAVKLFFMKLVAFMENAPHKSSRSQDYD